MAVVNHPSSPSSSAPQPAAPPRVRPWYIQPGSNATLLTRHEVAQRCRSILESDDYQQQLQTRIANGTLPAAVEQMIWYYAFGKPPEEINVSLQKVEEDLSTMSPEQLLSKMKDIQNQLEEVQRAADAIPAEYRVS